MRHCLKCLIYYIKNSIVHQAYFNWVLIYIAILADTI